MTLRVSLGLVLYASELCTYTEDLNNCFCVDTEGFHEL